MKLVHEKMKDIESLYVRHLRLLLSAEELIASKSQYLVELATDAELQQVLRKHAEESGEQAILIRSMLERASTDTDPFKCKVAYALFEEAEELVQDTSHDEVRNVLLIAIAQRVKHYEQAVYSSLMQYAKVLGRDEDSRILNQIAEEERFGGQQLSEISERVNRTAKRAA